MELREQVDKQGIPEASEESTPTSGSDSSDSSESEGTKYMYHHRKSSKKSDIKRKT